MASEKTNTAAPASRIMMAIMGSRVLGLVRDVMMNALFGASKELDAFLTAFRIPNLLRDLLAEGALSAAFVTTFSKTMSKDGKKAAFRVANLMLSSLLLLLLVLVGIGIFFSEELVWLIARGFEQEEGKIELTVELTQILFPFILFVSLAAIMMGLLNSLGSFGLPALASAAFNAGSIFFGLVIGYLYDPNLGAKSIYGFAIGTLLGGALQLLVQLPRAYQLGFRPAWELNWKDPTLLKIYRLATPAIIGVAAVQINVMVNSYWASYMGDGAVTWYTNAFRLMQLPIGMFGVAIGMVTLPSVSRSVVEENMHLFRRKVVEGLKLALFLALPASIGLMVLAEPIIGVIFEHGKFTAKDTQETAHLLQAFTIGLAGYAIIKVMAPTFYALDKPWIPVRVSLIAIVLNLGLTTFFIMGLEMGLLGLPLSISCVALLNLFQLSISLSRNLGSLSSGTDFPGFFLKLAICLGALVAYLLLIQWVLGAWVIDFWGRLGFLVVVIPSAVFVYGKLALIFRMAEIEDLLMIISSRLKGSGEGKKKNE